mmetsp:Transcript_17863/g.39598  ORF Transcript_17863/g.39598 Transcript_17863/m.39598 type:complete len:273 (+) Transcript_17863:435-1253(+)
MVFFGGGSTGGPLTIPLTKFLGESGRTSSSIPEEESNDLFFVLREESFFFIFPVGVDATSVVGDGAASCCGVLVVLPRPSAEFSLESIAAPPPLLRTGAEDDETVLLCSPLPLGMRFLNLRNADLRPLRPPPLPLAPSGPMPSLAARTCPGPRGGVGEFEAKLVVTVATAPASTSSVAKAVIPSVATVGDSALSRASLCLLSLRLWVRDRRVFHLPPPPPPPPDFLLLVSRSEGDDGDEGGPSTVDATIAISYAYRKVLRCVERWQCTNRPL